MSALEIGSRGVITARNHTVLAEVCSMCGINNLKTFRNTLGKISLLGSHRIYLARSVVEGHLSRPNPQICFDVSTSHSNQYLLSIYVKPSLWQ